MSLFGPADFADIDLGQTRDRLAGARGSSLLSGNRGGTARLLNSLGLKSQTPQ
jgi:hypothetical protein